MTVLPFRYWSRSKLLASLARMCEGVGFYVGAEEPLKPTPGQAIEDARLHAGQVTPDWSMTLYRRRPDSTVWHREGCPAWPVEPPWVQATGRPGDGLSCRNCGTLTP